MFFAVIDYLAVHTNVLEANCFPMFYIMDTCSGLVLRGAVCFQLAIKTTLMGGTLRFPDVQSRSPGADRGDTLQMWG